MWVGWILVLVFFLVLAVTESHTRFTFNLFNASTLDLFGNASVHSNVVSLTSESQYLFGRALYPLPVRMKNTTFRSFSTTFVFSMVPYSSDHSRSGHGLAFMMTPHKSPVGVLPTEFLGLLNLSSNGQPYNHLFAVEFDTIKNEEFQDINDNHVGVDINELSSKESKPAGYWISKREFQDLDLKSGQNIQAWIDYDHLEQELNVTIVKAGSPRPEKPLISLRELNLSAILEEEMYVGFSAATGTYVEDHYILAWSFSTNGAASPLDTTHLPSFLHNQTVNIGLIAIVSLSLTVVILVMVVGLLLWLKRRKRRNSVEEWESGYWPHRYSYRDLSIATKGFRDDQILGSGGSGRVYKGVLPGTGLQVAVKSICQEKAKEFVAEISSLGRLKHRNLVQIRGYCRRRKELFVVYDYMSNGSLDNLIFQNPNGLLAWGQRFKILKDVAAGLLYLHEEWEQTVVHRDIKTSNILLDADLNGKFGDFGLALLYEQNENPHTSRVVGTPGYIAPEFINTGKASTSTDVFSFGVVMLEVACGRRAVDAAQIVLVDWVRLLYGNDRLLDAADPMLGGDYVEDEMERLLKLAILCCDPRPQARPGMRQLVEILEDQDSLPPFLPLPFSYGEIGSI
ncbi:L-type lectin-domain containing receptor kinase SIT2 [Cryptomeria japonica]|uniref:L-type lectin-domain containing receptor kinase SIT2 n=1 Tax=Cryptomeria japonica TaxID=3369 RepID=UPI0027DA47D9|nr:L-type lectin-domain containing receptor kinase SIT2 [Cryptomeria japonica]